MSFKNTSQTPETKTTGVKHQVSSVAILCLIFEYPIFENPTVLTFLVLPFKQTEYFESETWEL